MKLLLATAICGAAKFFVPLHGQNFPAPASIVIDASSNSVPIDGALELQIKLTAGDEGFYFSRSCLTGGSDCAGRLRLEIVSPDTTKRLAFSIDSLIGFGHLHRGAIPFVQPANEVVEFVFVHGETVLSNRSRPELEAGVDRSYKTFFRVPGEHAVTVIHGAGKLETRSNTILVSVVEPSDPTAAAIQTKVRALMDNGLSLHPSFSGSLSTKTERAMCDELRALRHSAGEGHYFEIMLIAERSWSARALSPGFTRARIYRHGESVDSLLAECARCRAEFSEDRGRPLRFPHTSLQIQKMLQLSEDELNQILRKQSLPRDK